MPYPRNVTRIEHCKMEQKLARNLRRHEKYWNKTPSFHFMSSWKPMLRSNWLNGFFLNRQVSNENAPLFVLLFLTGIFLRRFMVLSVLVKNRRHAQKGKCDTDISNSENLCTVCFEGLRPTNEEQRISSDSVCHDQCENFFLGMRPKITLSVLMIFLSIFPKLIKNPLQ